MRALFLRLLAGALAALVAVQVLGGLWAGQDRHLMHVQEELVDVKLEWAAERLRAVPPAEWDAELHALRPSLAVHLTIVPPHAPYLPHERSVRLTDGARLVADPVGHLPPPLRWIVAQVVLGALAMGGVFWWLGRPVLKDLEALEAASRRIAGGELGARARLGDGPVGDLGAQFDTMAERVEGLIDGQKQLLAAVSHEIRTPLARMRFQLETLRDTAGDTAVDRLDRELDAIDDLLGELLEMARTEQPPLEAPEPGATVEVVNAVCRRMEGLSTAALEVDAAEGLPIGTKDLARIVENLVSNAQRHAGSKVRVTVAAGRLVVEDDGPGVPYELRERVFEPFHTGEKSRNRALGGVGLGLALVKRAAERWGATVGVDESPLGGARFTVAF